MAVRDAICVLLCTLINVFNSSLHVQISRQSVLYPSVVNTPDRGRQCLPNKGRIRKTGKAQDTKR